MCDAICLEAMLFLSSKLKNICVATGGKLPHFCQQTLHWLLSSYNTNYHQVLPVTVEKCFMTTVSILLYLHSVYH